MKSVYLVVGLGSMGKRRVRNLQALEAENIIGFDLREDRRKEAAEKYGIEVYDNIEQVFALYSVSAMVISVPPDIHHIYLKHAQQRNIPSFVEASVVDTDLKEILGMSRESNTMIAPSCTLFFHPAIQKIRDIIQDASFGKISNILYHSGQYLPDWHSYEKVSEYYVSKKETGGAREIVPFEMTWLTMVLGFPRKVTAMYKKTIQIDGAPDIDDTYNLLLDYDSFMLNLCVDVVSRIGTRRLTINSDQKQLTWNWDNNYIEIYSPVNNKWDKIYYDGKPAHAGYNPNITESMYIDEMSSFINGIKDGLYPNSLEHDLKVLGLLYAAEASFQNETFTSLA